MFSSFCTILVIVLPNTKNKSQQMLCVSLIHVGDVFIPLINSIIIWHLFCISEPQERRHHTGQRL